MLIIAWSSSGSLAAFFDDDVFRTVLSVFITQAFLNFFQGTGGINTWTWPILHCLIVALVFIIC